MKPALYQHLSQEYIANTVEKWDPILKRGPAIKSDAIRAATALVLENTHREFVEKGLITESYTGSGTGAIGSTGGFGAQAGSTNGNGALGSAFDYGPNDSRIPTIVIPTIRRIFPELVAHELFGVQPMNGPLGFAFALRSRYGVNGRGGASIEGTEIGYNTIDARFTGTSGLAEADFTSMYAAGSGAVAGPIATSNSYWQAFAGNPAGAGYNGMADTLANQEWLGVGEDMPMAKLQMEKGIVEARSRKLAANWSLELQEDMKSMHGLDVDAQMVETLTYESKAEIDRQLLGEAVKAAISAGNTSVWSPVSADGRHQLERIGTLYTQMLLKAQLIAKLTRRGAANFVVGSPTAIAMLERNGDYTIDKAGSGVDSLEKATGGVVKVGTFRAGTMAVYRDSFAGGDYLLLGFKGQSEFDAGIMFCPYIPLQLHRATSQQNFSPIIGVRTRYGVLANLFGSGNYYQMLALNGLTSPVLGGVAGGQLFVQ